MLRAMFNTTRPASPAQRNRGRVAEEHGSHGHPKTNLRSTEQGEGPQFSHRTALASGCEENLVTSRWLAERRGPESWPAPLVRARRREMAGVPTTILSRARCQPQRLAAAHGSLAARHR